jgi:hypothetical protein
LSQFCDKKAMDRRHGSARKAKPALRPVAGGFPQARAGC